MTTADTDDDPEKIAQGALTAAVETIEESREVDDKVEQVRLEREAIATFVEQMGEAAAAGLPNSSVSMYAGSLADETEFATKTDIKEDVQAETEAAARGASGAGPINGYLQDHVEEIVVIRTTDAHQTAVYRWKFDTGEHTFEIETGANAPTSHFDAKAMRLAIFDSVGDWPAKPVKELRGSEDWQEFIVPFINEHKVEATSIGPRTAALDELRNLISQSRSYPRIEDMVVHHGVRIDDDPEDGDPSEIWVHYPEITTICEEHAIQPRALQAELDARDLTVERVNGVSQRQRVHGSRITYWVLDADIETPAVYDPDPDTPMDRVEQWVVEEEQGEDEDEEDEEATPGLIGSTDPTQLDPAEIIEDMDETDDAAETDGGEDE